jgi:3' terminal RNA ribose 2'-O-methyltransferase Hen1
MLLTITNTQRPATDLGYLLHKNPARAQTFEQSFGHVHVFYPEATPERCTAALLLDVDPVALVRGRRGSTGEGGLLDQYVNDRPYVASSFMSVAIARVLNSALGGRCKDRPELVEARLPLTVRLTSVPSRGGEALLRRLFEPLGYAVAVTPHSLDPQFPEWGESVYFTLTLAADVRLQDLLSHLYVLIPVLDDDKHYWVGEDEVEKLLRHGEGWLAEHPEKNLIAKRYLKHYGRLTREALARLVTEDEPDPDQEEEQHAAEEAAVERRISLNEQRLGVVLAALRQAQAHRVVDLGCGEGKLIKELLKDKGYQEILGMDVSYRELERAQSRLEVDRMPEHQKGRLKLIQGSLTYRDRRLEGFDAATLIEVIEHLDSPRLAALERVVFQYARPVTVIVTTPNVEYNVQWESLPAGKMRHRDHRFEWTRAEFQAWAEAIAAAYGYAVRFMPVGPDDAVTGPPTQMGVFTRVDAATASA